MVGARELAVRWADLLDGAVAPTLTRAQVVTLLSRYTPGLITAIREGGDTAIAREIAAALVAANYRDSLAVHRSVLLICVGLLDADYPDPAAPDYFPARTRALQVAAEFAAAFTADLRTAALAEQETTLAAALTAAREAEARRQLSEARFEAIFTGASVGIGTIDITTGQVVDVNAAMAETLGFARETMPGRSVADILGPQNIGHAFAEFQRLLSGEVDRFRLETEHSRPDGSHSTIDLSMSVVRDGDGNPRFLVGVTVDITERKQLADRLWHDAHHDSLTGLPNRLLFFDRLATAVPPVGVCYLDLDGFKEINDERGHTAGDRVLRDVATRLLTTVSAVGGMAARIGGDEFIVLVERCGADELAKLAEEIRTALACPFEVDGQQVTVGASIGTAVAETAPAVVDDLMHTVDTAMYANKSQRTPRQAYGPRGR
ncbi:diguanylate cyclase domain-containing protein [Nocardia uniformis]|uniref:diguanylate cyclase domain-containing protein n=1 Tax=Nocardia uniformis TaxID=53432 RepID=UPI000A4E632C|nr:diguanylate cyclase [Nocardia uniformis]